MRALAGLLVISAMLAACGGGGAPQTSPYGAPATAAPSAAASPRASQPVASPAASGDYYKEDYGY